MNYLGLTLLWCAIQVTIFAVVSAGLYLSMRRRSPAARSTVLAASLVSVVLLTGLAWSPWPRWVPDGNTTPAIVAENGNNETNSGAHPSQDTDASAHYPMTDDSSTMLFLENLWHEMKHAPVEPAEQASAAWSWQAIVAWLFLGVFALGMLRLISGILAVRRYRFRSEPIDSVELNSLLEGLQLQLACRRPIELRMSQEVTSPATIGWRKPIILLPLEWEEWNQHERTAVIAHEVAHIKRFDFPAWFAAQVGVVLHFYHPVVHWLARRLRLEQELAADAAAADVLGGNSQYLQTLAGMALRRDNRSLNWAARTFLPSRHTFIRRIEMLRRRNVLTFNLSTVGRSMLAVLMIAAAVFAAGWRSPFEQVAVAQQSQPDSPDKASEVTEFGFESEDGRFGATSAALSEPLSLSYVPRDAVIVLAARPSTILSKAVLAPIKQALDKQGGLQETFGFDIRNVRQVTVASLPEEREGKPNDPAIIVHFNDEFDQQTLLKNWVHDWEEKDLGTQKYYQSKRRNACAFPDARTAIFARKSSDIIRILAAGERGASKANWIDAWNRVADSQAAAMFDLQRMRAAIDEEFDPRRRPNPMLIFHPIWRQGKRLVWGLDVNQEASLQVILECEEGQANEVADTVKAAVTLARNGLSAFRAEAAGQGGAEALMAIKAADLADELIDQTKLEVKDDVVSANLTLGEEIAEIVTLAVPAIMQARAAAKRTQAMNNMKMIGLAMHNYHDVHKHFPSAVVMGPDGKTPHSWRVEILPFLDQKALYDEYRMTEPWDSEHNKKLLEKIPPMLRCPMEDQFTTNTSYFALTGKGTVFDDSVKQDGEAGIRFADITDGSSNTIMVVESKKAVPWTKPEDIPIDLEKDIPKFGGWHPGGYIGLFCDGSVKFLSSEIDQKLLKALISRNGGEPVQR